MNTSSFNPPFEVRCCYRTEGVFCHYGQLVLSKPEEEGNSLHYHAVTVDGVRVNCPACEGQGIVFTELGKQAQRFFEERLLPGIREEVQRMIEERL